MFSIELSYPSYTLSDAINIINKNTQLSVTITFHFCENTIIYIASYVQLMSKYRSINNLV